MVENITATAISTAGSIINRTAAGLVILIAGLALGLLVKKVSFRILQGISLNKVLAGNRIPYDGERMLSSFFSYLIYFSAIFLFLEQLGITSLTIYLALAGLFALLVLTAMAGLKDTLLNGWAGLKMRRKNLWKEGRQVVLAQISGKVLQRGYFETKVKTRKGDILYLPNSLCFKRQVKT